MDMHPALTTVVYLIIAIVFAIAVISLIVYTRRMNISKVTMAEKGRLPLDKEEGILLATRKNEGRTGTPTL